MIVVRKISTLDGINRFLQGDVHAGADLRNRVNQLYLNSKTLILTAPSVTITFASTPAGDQSPMNLPEVLAQITAQAAAVKPTIENGQLALKLIAGGPVVVDKGGTANSILGFDTTADTVGVVYNPPGGAQPSLISVSDQAMAEEAYLLVTDEAP